MTISRRHLLQATAAGTAAALIGLGRKSARGAGPARARRVLILNSSGGMRTTTAFHASPRTSLNPYGVLGQAGALRLGAVLRGDETDLTYAAPSWGAGVTVPPIDEAARGFAVIAATDHVPDGSYRPGDHNDDGMRMGTGYYLRYDAPGVLTVLNRHLGPQANAPVVTLGGTYFDLTLRLTDRHQPILAPLKLLRDTQPFWQWLLIGRLGTREHLFDFGFQLRFDLLRMPVG